MKLSIPSNLLLNKLQLASITGTDLTLSGDEVTELYHLAGRIRIYHLCKGLPDELVALINQP